MKKWWTPRAKIVISYLLFAFLSVFATKLSAGAFADQFYAQSVTETSITLYARGGRNGASCCGKRGTNYIEQWNGSAWVQIGQAGNEWGCGGCCTDQSGDGTFTVTGLAPGGTYSFRLKVHTYTQCGQDEDVYYTSFGLDFISISTEALSAPSFSLNKTGENTVQAVLSESSTVSNSINIYLNGNYYTTVSGGTYNWSVPPVSSTFVAKVVYGPTESAGTSRTANLFVNPPSLPVSTLMGDQNVMLNWSNTSSISSQVRIRRNGTTLATNGGSPTFYMDQNIPFSASLNYCISAFFQFGGQDYESSQQCVTVNSPPIAPVTNLRALFTGENTIEFAWKNNSLAADVIRIYRDGNLLTTLTKTDTSYVDNNLALNTAHTYCVEPYDNDRSVAATRTCGNFSTTTISPVSGLQASVITDGKIVLIWKTLTSGIADQINLYRNGSLIATLATTATTYEDLNLNPNTTYTYYAESKDLATNQTGSSNTITPKTLPLLAPVGFSATDAYATDKILLSWTNVSDLATEFRVYRNSIQITTLPRTLSNAYTFEDNISDGPYNYCVESFFSGQTSTQVCDQGNTIRAGLKASDATNDAYIRLDWNIPATCLLNNAGQSVFLGIKDLSTGKFVYSAVMDSVRRILERERYRPPYALLMEGANDVVTLPQVNLPTTGWSAELWFRADTFPTSSATLLSNSSGNALVTLSHEGIIKAGNDTLSPSAVFPGQWTLLSLVYDGTDLQSYVNGRRAQKIANYVPSNTSPGGSPIFGAVGNRQTGAQGLRGYLGEFRLWREARTEPEIHQNRFLKYQKPLPSTLIAAWVFDEKGASTVLDEGGNYLATINEGDITDHELASIFNTQLTDSYFHYVGTDQNRTYKLELYTYGSGTPLCTNLTFQDAGSTLPFQQVGFTAGDNQYTHQVRLEVTPNPLSAIAEAYQFYRVKGTDTTNIGSIPVTADSLVFYDRFNFSSASSLKNGATYTYLVRVQSFRFKQLFPAVADQGSTVPINFVATDNAFPDRVALSWNNISAYADALTISRDGTPLAKLAPNTSAYQDLSPIPGKKHIYELLLAQKGANLIGVMDTGSVLRNGRISGRVITQKGDFGVPLSKVVIKATIEGVAFRDSILTDSTGYFEFSPLYYAQQTGFTISVSKLNHVFTPVLRVDTLNQNKPHKDGLLFRTTKAYFQIQDTLPALSQFNVAPASGDNAVNLTWAYRPDPKRKPTLFKIYRGQELLTILQDRTTFQDTCAKPGSMPKYRLFAYTLWQDTTREDTLMQMLAVPELLTPAPFTATSNSTLGTVELQWTYAASSGYTGFSILRDSVEIARVSRLPRSYTDLEGVPGRNHKYQISVFWSKFDTLYNSDTLSASTVYPILPEPTAINTSVQHPFRLLTWTQSADANYNFDGWAIFRTLSGGGSVDTLGFVPKGAQLKFLDVTGIPSSNYTYSVKSYAATRLDTLRLSQGLTTGTLPYPALNPPTLTASDNLIGKVELTWTPAAGQLFAGYLLYRDGTLIQRLAPEKNRFVDYWNGQAGDLTFVYSLKEYDTRNGVEVQSAASADNGTAKGEAQIAYPPAPTDFTASREFPSQIQLAWTYPAYIIPYFELLRNGTPIDTLEGGLRSYKDFGLIPGQEYEYSIRAVRDGQKSNWTRATGELNSIIEVLGSVRYAANGKGVSNALVSLKGPAGLRYMQADSNGVFRFIDITDLLGANMKLLVSTPDQLYVDSISFVLVKDKLTYQFEIEVQNGSMETMPDKVAQPYQFSHQTDYVNNVVRFSWALKPGKYDSCIVYRGLFSIGVVRPGEPLSFVDSTAAAGVVFAYRIAAVYQSDTALSKVILVENPIILPIRSLDAQPVPPYDEVFLTFNHLTNLVDFYLIERNNEPIAVVNPSQQLCFADTTGLPGRLYNYTVKAVKGANVSFPITVRDIPFPVVDKVDSLTAQVTGNGIQLDWKHRSLRCRGFNVYRDSTVIAVLSDGEFQYTDYGATPESEPLFGVSSFYLANDGNVYESDIAYVQIKQPRVTTPTITATPLNAENAVEIAWQFPDSIGVDEIAIYRKTIEVLGPSVASNNLSQISIGVDKAGRIVVGVEQAGAVRVKQWNGSIYDPLGTDLTFPNGDYLGNFVNGLDSTLYFALAETQGNKIYGWKKGQWSEVGGVPGQSSGARIAVDASGRLFMAWFDPTNGAANLARRNTNGTWSQYTTPRGNIRDVRLSLASNGDAYLGFVQKQGSAPDKLVFYKLTGNTFAIHNPYGTPGTLLDVSTNSNPGIFDFNLEGTDLFVAAVRANGNLQVVKGTADVSTGLATNGSANVRLLRSTAGSYYLSQGNGGKAQLYQFNENQQVWLRIFETSSNAIVPDFAVGSDDLPVITYLENAGSTARVAAYDKGFKLYEGPATTSGTTIDNTGVPNRNYCYAAQALSERNEKKYYSALGKDQVYYPPVAKPINFTATTNKPEFIGISWNYPNPNQDGFVLQRYAGTGTLPSTCSAFDTDGGCIGNRYRTCLSIQAVTSTSVSATFSGEFQQVVCILNSHTVRLQYKLSSSGTWITASTLSINQLNPSQSFTITGLTPGTSYDFRADGNISIACLCSLAATTTAVTVVTNGTLEQTTQLDAGRRKFSDNPNDGNQHYYLLRAKRTVEGEDYFSEPISTNSVNANDVSGSVISSLSATDGTSKTQVVIEWTVASLGTTTGFAIYRAEGLSGDFKLLENVGPDKRIYRDGEADPGIFYVYYVAATNSAGTQIDRKSDGGFRAGEGTITGKVYNTSGSPLVGVDLFAEGEIDGETITYRTSTNTRGDYSLTGLFVGSATDYRVYPRYLDHTFLPNEQLAELTKDVPNTALDLFLDKDGYSLSGTASYLVGGCAIPNLKIVLKSYYETSTEPRIDTLTTDESGFYNQIIDVNDPFLTNVVLTPIENRQVEVEGIKRTHRHDFGVGSITFTKQQLLSFGDQKVVNFTDKIAYEVKLEVENACGDELGEDVFYVLVKSSNGCFVKSYPTTATGRLTLKLPPLDYEIRVTGVQDLRSNNIPIIEYLKVRPRFFGLDTIHAYAIGNVPVPLDSSFKFKMQYHTAPKVVVQGFTSSCANEDVKIIEGGKDVNLSIKVTEDFGGGSACNLTNGLVRIINPAAATEKDVTFVLDSFVNKGGIIDYTFVAGEPFLISPFRHYVSVEYYDESGNYLSGQVIQVLINNGRKALAGNDVLVNPGAVEGGSVNFPLMVLRDPPGDGSFSYLNKGNSTDYSIKLAESSGGSVGGGLNFDLKIFGIGSKLKTEFINGGSNSNSSGFAYSVATTEKIQTDPASTIGQDGEYVDGTDADVIVGWGLAQQYGFVYNMKVDQNKCQVNLVQEVGLTGLQVQTQWQYTINQINDLLVPELIMKKGQVKDGTLKLTGKGRFGDARDTTFYANLINNWKQILHYYNYETVPFCYLCDQGYLNQYTLPIWLRAKLNASIGGFCSKLKTKAGAAASNGDDFCDKAKAVLWDDELLNAYNQAAATFELSYEYLSKNQLKDVVKSVTNISSSSYNNNLVENAFNSAYGAFGIDARNITFGGNTTRESEVTVVRSKQVEFAYDYKFNFNFEATVGVAFEEELKLETGTATGIGVAALVEISKSAFQLDIQPFLNSTAEYTREVSGGGTQNLENTVGYVLSDDDDGDQFSVTVIRGLVGTHTPYFQLIGGRSTCPYESGTIDREYCSMVLENQDGTPDDRVKFNIPANGGANYSVSMANLNPFNETRSLKVYYERGTNPYGAIITVNGSVPDPNQLFYPPPIGGDKLYANITIERNPFSQIYQYEDILVCLVPECYAFGYNIPNREEACVQLSAFFTNPCTDLSIVEPGDNWLINDGVPLQVKATDYDLNNVLFKGLRFQYRRKGTLAANLNNDFGWTTTDFIDKDSLQRYYDLFRLVYPKPTYNYVWNNIGLIDGEYEIRMVADCGTSGTIFSNVFDGKIARGELYVFGKPEPADGILSFEDDVRVQFNKPLDQARKAQLKLYVVHLETGDTLQTVTSQIAGNMLNVTIPEATLNLLDNQHLKVYVDKVYDAEGNTLLAPVEWSFLVIRNPVYWFPMEYNLRLYKGKKYKVATRLFNSSKSNETLNVNLFGMDSWLDPQQLSFPINNSGLIDTFEIDARSLQLDTIYRDTVFANVVRLVGPPFNQMPYVIFNVEVLATPPAWDSLYRAQTFGPALPMLVEANWQFTTSTTPSVDTLDLISVWSGNKIRGVAPVRRIGNYYSAALQINIADGDQLGSPLEFRVWDASTDTEYTAYGDSTLKLRPGQIIASVLNPFIVKVNALTDRARYIPLNSAGWTWFSLNSKEPDMSVGAVLRELNPLPGDIISNRQVKAVYNGSAWIPVEMLVQAGDTLLMDTMNVRDGYMIYLRDPRKQSIRVTGNAAAPETKLVLKGWNFIGYPSQTQVPITDTRLNAIQNISNGDVILSNLSRLDNNTGSNAAWTAGAWLPGTYPIKPNRAYLLNMKLNGLILRSATNNERKVHLANLDDWQWLSDDLPEQMLTYVTIENLPEGAKEDWALGVFDGNEVRGLATLIDAPGINRWLLQISGDRKTDKLDLRLRNRRTGLEYRIKENLDFLGEQLDYDWNDPMPLHLGNAIKRKTSLDISVVNRPETLKDVALEAFPNPFSDELQVALKAPPGSYLLLLRNMDGRRIAFQKWESRGNGAKETFPWTLTDIPAGMYYLELLDKRETLIQRQKLVKTH